MFVVVVAGAVAAGVEGASADWLRAHKRVRGSEAGRVIEREERGAEEDREDGATAEEEEEVAEEEEEEEDVEGAPAAFGIAICARCSVC